MMHDWQGWLYVAAVLVPLAAFVVQVLGLRVLKRANALIATGAIVGSFVLAAIGFVSYFAASGGMPSPEHAEPGELDEELAAADAPPLLRVAYQTGEIGAANEPDPDHGAGQAGEGRLDRRMDLGGARRGARRAGHAVDPDRHLRRQPDGDHVRDGHLDREPDPRLLDVLHGRRPALSAVLRLSLALLLLDARPGGVGQRLHGLHLLGAGRRLLVPADRLLVRGEGQRRRGQQGVHRQPDRRRRHARRPRPALDAVRHLHDRRHQRGPRRGRGAELRRRSAGSPPATRRWSTRSRSPAAVRSIPHWVLVLAGLGIFAGCVGKSAQFPLARLAPRRDGRPDPRLGPDPRGDDGGRGRLPRRAFLPAVHGGSPADHRLRRRHHPVPRRLDRHRPGRLQEGPGVFDRQPARLHDAGAGRRRLGGRAVPPADARLLQGPAVPRRRQHPPRGPHLRPPAARRLAEEDAGHRDDDAAGDARHLRRPAAQRLLLEGRDPRRVDPLRRRASEARSSSSCCRPSARR